MSKKRLGFKGILFAILNPVMASRLIFGSKKFGNPKLQKKLLQNDVIWNRVVKLGNTDLKDISAQMNKLGVAPEIFGNNGILSESGVSKISKIFSDPKDVEAIRKIAIESIDKDVNQNKVINNVLSLLGNSKNFKEYFADRGDALKNYICKNIKESRYEIDPKTKTSTLTPIGKQMEDLGITDKNIDSIMGVIPMLLNEPKTMHDMYNQFSKGKVSEVAKTLINATERNPGIKDYLVDNRELFNGLINNVVNHSLKGNKENNEAIKGELYNIVPILLEEPKELVNIIELQEQGLNEDAGKGFIGLLRKNDKIQNYIHENKKAFIQLSANMLEFDKKNIKVNDSVLDLLEHISKQENLSHMDNILDMCKKQNYTGVIKETCKMLDEDPNFVKYMKNNKEDLGKIIDYAVTNSPAIKQYTRTVKMGGFTSNLGEVIFKNHKDLYQAVDGFEKGNYVKSAYNIGNIVWQAQNKDIYSAGKDAAYDVWSHITKSHNNRKEFFSKLHDVIQDDKSIPKNAERKNINDITEELLHVTGDSELAQQFHEGNLFCYTNIDKLNFENIELKNTHFVNTSVNNVSFKNSKLENIAFHGSTLNNVDFTGAELDANSFISLMSNVAKNSKNINLDGAKIVGPMNDLDMQAINDKNMQNLDFSNVTSMTNLDLKDMDFSNVKLPENMEILEECYNLHQAKFGKDFVLSDKIVKRNKEYQIKQFTQNIKNNLYRQNPETKIDIKNLKTELYKLADKSEIIKEKLDQSVSDPSNLHIILPLKEENLESINKFDSGAMFMNEIYNNVDNLGKLHEKLVVNKLATKIGVGLFQDSSNKGRIKDTSLIKKIIEKSIEQGKEKYPKDDIENYISKIENSMKDEKFIQNLQDKIYEQTQYTKAGLATGGIQLSQKLHDSISEDLTKDLSTIIVSSAKYKNQDKALAKDIIELVQKNSNLKVKDEESALSSLTKVMSENPEIKNRFFNIMNDHDIKSVNLPIDKTKIQNLEDLKSNNYLLSNIIEIASTKPQELSNKLISSVIVQETSKELFGQGDGRVQDGVIIESIFSKAIENINKKGKYSHLDKLLNDENEIKKIAPKIKDILYKHTKYTAAGYATGGVYLPQNVNQDKIANEVQSKLHEVYTQYTKNKIKNSTKQQTKQSGRSF